MLKKSDGIPQLINTNHTHTHTAHTHTHIYTRQEEG